MTVEKLFTPDDLSVYLGIPTRTLGYMRIRGTGPPFARIGRHVRYRPSDVDAWLEANAVEPRPRSLSEEIRDALEGSTPGPWFTEAGGIYNATRSYLVVPTGDSEQDRADAALIAAAPSLLARAADALDALDGGSS